MRQRRARKTRSAAGVDWQPDMPIFLEVVDNSNGSLSNPSRFSDESWEVFQYAKKATITKKTVSFAKSPPEFKDTVKRLVWCMLNLETPIQLLERPNAARSRPSVATAVSNMEAELRPFFLWLSGRGIRSLDQASATDLRCYGDEVARSNLARHTKARRLWGPSRCWLFAPCLPAEDQLVQPPWETEGTQDWLGPANWSAENKTSPIHPQTMSPLIRWAIRFVAEFAHEICAALQERALMVPRQAGSPGDVRKVADYLNGLKRRGKKLPGYVERQGVHQGRLVVGLQYLSASLGVGTYSLQHRATSSIGVAAGCPLKTRANARVNGKPWIDYFDYYEVEDYRQLLAAACVVVIAYLSGMRPEECRALRRGCCREVRERDGVSRFEIRGLAFKEMLDEDGNAIRGGAMRSEPWHVVRPVYEAVSALERLHHRELLLSEEAFNLVPGKRRGLAMAGDKISHRIEKFIGWCNEASERLGAPQMAIPPDPDGRITLRRFRRTLAWFIYRQPGGRISLGIQYGHLSGLATDGYGSRASAGLRDVFPVEEAYAIADSLHSAAERLRQGEGVSGPSADRYIAGVLEYAQTYKGKYLTPRQAAQLRRNPALRIYDNGIQPVACCYDATKALCHPSRDAKSGPGTTPDLTRCDPRCSNVARTDNHIAEIRREVNWQKEQAESKITPEPLRERHWQRIAVLEELIGAHEAGRHTRTEIDR